MSEVCPVCADNFTKKLRYKVECFSCNYTACCKCIRQFILLDSNVEANCMNCKMSWNDKFVYEQLTPSFFLNKYRNHIKNMAVQQQLALVPASQLDAERVLSREKLNKININLHNLTSAYNVISKVDEVDFIIDFKQNLLNLITNKKAERDRLKEFCDSGNSDKKVYYSRPCGNVDCKGMLQSNKTLCGLCNKNTCQKCFKVYEKDIKHECNPDDIATAKLIKSDTKYCPKCNFGITKINGCDVMFCTQCATSFHWKTLQVLTKNLHNPHYVEYLRNNGTIQERNNLANNCTANPTITDFDMQRFRSIHHFCNKITYFNEYAKYASRGMKIVDKILHYDYLRQSIQQKVNQSTVYNNDLRVRLLLSRMSLNFFDKTIKSEFIICRIYTQLQQILETIVTVGTDLMYNYSNNELLALNTILQNLNTTYGIVELNKKSLEFFTSNFSLNTFVEMEEKIGNIEKNLDDVISHCKQEAYKLGEIYKKKRMISRFI